MAECDSRHHPLMGNVQQVPQRHIGWQVEHAAMSTRDENCRIIVQGFDIGHLLWGLHHCYDLIVEILDILVLCWVGPHLKDHWPASGSCDVKLEACITKVKHWHKHLNGVVAGVENLAVLHFHFPIVCTHDQDGLVALVL